MHYKYTQKIRLAPYLHHKFSYFLILSHTQNIKHIACIAVFGLDGLGEMVRQSIKFGCAWHLKRNEKTLIERVLLGFLLYPCTKLAPTEIEKARIRKEFGPSALLNRSRTYERPQQR